MPTRRTLFAAAAAAAAAVAGAGGLLLARNDDAPEELLLPEPSGTDDSAALNDALARARGRKVRGRPGAEYRISAPLVVYSGTTVDMTGCTITLLAAGNLLVNAAVRTTRRLLDAAMKAGSATLTAPTGFLASDVGQRVEVQGAGPGGSPLITTVAAIGDSGTTCTLAASASTSVTGQYAAIGERDHDITITGGTWIRAESRGSLGVDLHTLRFRHVDRLTLRGLIVETSSDKYAISLGDIADTTIADVQFSVHSDGVHIQGPAWRTRVSQIRGDTGDDTVAITPRDWEAYDDVFGPVVDTVIEDVSANSAAAVIKVLGGDPQTAALRTVVRGVAGRGRNHAVIVGDDRAQPRTTGGRVDDLTIERVTATTVPGRNILCIDGSNIRRCHVRGLAINKPEGPVVWVGYRAALVELTLEDVHADELGDVPLVSIEREAAVRRLTVDGATVGNSVEKATCFQVAGKVDELTIGGIQARLAAGGRLLALPTSSASATVGQAMISDVHLIGNGSGLVAATRDTHILSRVAITNTALSGPAWLCDLNTSTELHLSGVSTEDPIDGVVRVRRSAALTVRADNLKIAPHSQMLAIASGGAVTSLSLALAVDVSKLRRTAGAKATNTNARLSCGTGPVQCDGVWWRHLYTGATY